MIKNMLSGYYDIVFMDIQMPNIDRYEATHRIRRLEQSRGGGHIPIAAMFANAFVGNMDKAYTAGMVNYITKPIAPEAAGLPPISLQGATGRASMRGIGTLLEKGIV